MTSIMQKFLYMGEYAMSKFAVYLKELLEQRGEPISRVAKNTGLERTSIHKALKDERLLSYTALKKLSQYLQLTLSQTRELNLYYEILLQGEDAYRVREAIGELLSSLAQLHFSRRELYALPSSLPLSAPLPEFVYGRPQVEAALQTLLDRETADGSAPNLTLCLPPDGVDAAGLFRLWRSGRSFTVRQILAFLPEHLGVSSQLANLRLLRSLLPLSLASAGQYHAYYYFEHASAPASLDPMPYFFVTPHCLVRLDSQLSAARFESSPQMIRLYENHFSQLLGECQPLNSYSNDLEHILDSYMKGTDAGSYYTMMTQPCLGRYYTRERIQRHFRPNVPNREALVEMSDQRFARLRELEGDYYTIFTEDGLRELARTGVAADLPPELILPIDRPTRIELLTSFRDDIQAGRIHGCIADMEKLPIPPYLTLTCDPKFGVHLYATQGFIGGAYACNLHIEESGIGRAFSSFIRALPESKYVYPTQRTLEILDQLLLELSLENQEEDP